MPLVKLPSPEMCSELKNGFNSTHWRVNVSGNPDKPEWAIFSQPPTREEIAQAVADARARRKTAEQQPQQQSRRKE